ncbi:apolipoprotein N-acyltransferase [Porphyrobacter sp. GA68]|uniref:apolipoprotein N-acyltransferase n=1 Tax=Porphyrobacter sp. GA68 TaxID=2883480 RepID=UPI001D1803D5|nr:apolipoprotein N-acyltransferase [Porphyrobacter sp. GA68]
MWLAPLLGGIAATGFPPLRLWPLAFVAMGAFVLLLQRTRSGRLAFLTGWLFGVAHYTVTNNWIATAFTYQANMPPALGWAAVPLLSLYLAVYPGLAALMAHKVARQWPPAGFAWLLGACWIVAEWLKSWVFTGYAWGPFSLAFLGGFDRAGLAAVLPVTGTYALSGLMVAIAGLFALLLAERRWRVAGLVAALLAAGMVWPAQPLARPGTLPVTLVQPDFRQEDLANPQMAEPHFVRAARLSLPEQPGRTRLVLWPESGVSDYLRDGYPQRYYNLFTAGADPGFARTRLGQVIGDGSLLLTGATDLEIAEVDGVAKAVGAYNSVTAVNAQGRIVGSYYKAHLVPYGEYLALRWLLEPLGATRLVPGAFDFIPGPGPQTLDLGAWGRAGVQICYEIIFSGQVVDPASRPDYLFNPSNDGWFGAWGPPQHLAQARMRAIEEGLPVLRATTTGISAVISADGVVRHHIGMRQAARIDTLVPPAAPPTLFSRAGHWLTLLWTVALTGAALVAIRLQERYGRQRT